MLPEGSESHKKEPLGFFWILLPLRGAREFTDLLLADYLSAV